MSNPAVVPFSIAHPQQSYRLLELPPDLLDLLTSSDNNKKKPEYLELKSARAAVGGGGGGGNGREDEYVHLCTNTNSWAIRQVSTSNSVHVTRLMPSIDSTTTMTSTMTTTTPPTSIAAAISKPTSYLELMSAVTSAPPGRGVSAEATEEDDASPLLEEIVKRVKRIVPTARGGEREAVKAGANRRDGYGNGHGNGRLHGQQAHVTKEEVLAALPYPRAWIVRALHELLAFTVPFSLAIPGADEAGNGNCNSNSNSNSKNDDKSDEFVYRPSPELLFDAWTRFTHTLDRRGVLVGDVVHSLSVDDAHVHIHEVVNKMVEGTEGDEDEGEGEADKEKNRTIAASVINALLTRFSSENPPPSQTEQEQVQHQHQHQQQQQQAKAKALTLLLGRALVKAGTTTNATHTLSRTRTGLTKLDLERKWTALVPLDWERYCRVSDLGSKVQIKIRSPTSMESQSGGGGGSIDDQNLVIWESSDDDHDHDHDDDKYDGQARKADGKAADRGKGGGGGGGGAAAAKKRKWHDMFAQQREQKR